MALQRDLSVASDPVPDTAPIKRYTIAHRTQGQLFALAGGITGLVIGSSPGSHHEAEQCGMPTDRYIKEIRKLGRVSHYDFPGRPRGLAIADNE
ncbi:hypothetical protein QRB36_05210 [Mycobacterium marseillense]|uniref:hypothetical protein n=1 Tax=Mycobacterium colombiense TaxID=339268 RepID=UPI00131A2C23|nr:hypothetical protein [Mycobacterium colombiense]MDM3973563.1 hypothetical protein [Mycobacterium marseillense]